MAVMLAAMVLMFAIRAPHGARSARVKVTRSAKDRRELVLLVFARIGYLAPLAWMAVPALSVADYPQRPAPLFAGTACLALGLWVFHRSHVDLGTNWSVTLEIREQHRLVTHASTVPLVTRCTPRFCSIASARLWWCRTGLRVRRTSSPCWSSYPSAFLPRSG